MQVINFFYKGKQKRIKNHMRTRHIVYFEDKFFNKKKLNVNSFHNFGIPINLLAKCLVSIALDKSKNVEFCVSSRIWSGNKFTNLFGFVLSYNDAE